MGLGIISPYIIAIIVAWILAHIIKHVVSVVKGKRRSLSGLFESGGMPSSHSASVVALMTVIGFRDHFESGLFGLAALFALIVMYDAMKVRRSSGEQGVAVHKLIKEHGSDINLPRVSIGHTQLEVFAGAILGAIIGAVVFLSTK